jgi:hypothetical protein
MNNHFFPNGLLCGLLKSFFPQITKKKKKTLLTQNVHLALGIMKKIFKFVDYKYIKMNILPRL